MLKSLWTPIVYSNTFVTAFSMLLNYQGNVSENAPHLPWECGVHRQRTVTMLEREFCNVPQLIAH